MSGIRGAFHAIAVVAVLVFSISTASAECWLDGQRYPEGTRLGPFVCVDGEWVPGLRRPPEPGNPPWG
ncbi:MAG TPA: hypothetical protein VK943_01145 [Arenibaculum sp.]|nr:hypothetical protein [Arenibaculum sp.]